MTFAGLGASGGGAVQGEDAVAKGAAGPCLLVAARRERGLEDGSVESARASEGKAPLGHGLKGSLKKKGLKKKEPKKKSRHCVRFPPESARCVARCYLGQRWAGILKYHIVEFILSLIDQVLVTGGSSHPCHPSALLAGRSVKAGLGSWHVQEGCCRAVCPSQAQVSAGAGLISSTATFWGSSYVGEPR